MKYFIFCFIAAAVFLSGPSARAQPGQWNYLGPNPFYLGGGHDAFGDFTFADSLTGYGIDDVSPRFMKTTDGGRTWQLQPIIIAGAKEQFLNADTGWILGTYALTKTTNGGATWGIQFDTTMIGRLGCSFATLQFLDQATGFIAGTNYAGKTTDGGNTWSTITPPGHNVWQQMFFLNSSTGWLFDSDSLIAKTADGGQTWVQEVLTGVHSGSALAGHFYSSTNGFVITSKGLMLKTTDGGNSWNQISLTASHNLQAAKFGANGFVYALGKDTFFTSTDTGYTWVMGTCPESYKAIYFSDPQHGYVGLNHVYQTADGGGSWRSQTSQFSLTGESIYNYGWEGSGHMVAPFVYGFQESFDNGINWTINSTSSLLDIQDIDTSLYFIRQRNFGVSRYENGVSTFSLPTAYTLVFAKSRDSFIVSYKSVQDSLTILRTLDGGNSWQTIFACYDTNKIVYGEWWDVTNEYTLGFSSNFARFSSWDTGVVAYREADLISHEFITFDAAASWITLPPTATDFIASTKVSPTGGLYGYRTNGRQYAFYKFNTADSSWQFISLPSLYTILSDDGGPDFDWSFDNILWSSGSPDDVRINFIYSLDSGYTWNNYPLYINGTTMFKRTHEGDFVCGTPWGELLQYDGLQYNCRISGNVFYDLNSNGVFDGYDVPAAAYPVNVMPEGLVTFTDANGNYITAADSGSQTVFPDTQFNYRIVPGVLPVSINSQTGISTGNNFALQPVDTNFRDLALSMQEFGDSAPGFTCTSFITYSNFGVQPVQPVLSVTIDAALTFDSASVPITSQIGNTLTWNLPVINPFQSNTILLYTTLSANAQVGQVVTNTGIINPIIADSVPANNYDTSSFVVSTGHLTNYKVVNQPSISYNQSKSQSQLEYTIHFQNTGKAVAPFVVIKDIISSALNPASLRVIASSAPCSFNIEMGNMLVFTFNNIMLPDSSQSPTGSQGFVSFTISPLAENLNVDTIYNSASIYFGYNPAVNTNFAKTAVSGITTGIKEVYGDLNLSVYPNPANNIVHVESNADFTARLFDLLGRPVLTGKSVNSKLAFNVNNLASGMYILQVLQDSKLKGFELSIITQ